MQYSCFSEAEFELLGLISFFETASDSTVDWEDFFNQFKDSWRLMEAQEQNGTMQMLNEPEEDAWDEF
jgi:hypothetical protein